MKLIEKQCGRYFRHLDRCEDTISCTKLLLGNKFHEGDWSREEEDYFPMKKNICLRCRFVVNSYTEIFLFGGRLRTSFSSSACGHPESSLA